MLAMYMYRLFYVMKTGARQTRSFTLRRSRDCLILCVAVWVVGSVFVYIIPSLHSARFGQPLRCAHKRIVNIMKVYIERDNMQVVTTLITRDMPPLFCAQSSHGKSFPDVRVR